MEGQSKKSKKTKSKSRTRATSTSRKRKLKGGTNNSTIKEKIKEMIGYRTGDRKFDTALYTANYPNIYDLWRNLPVIQKKVFEKEFIQVAKFNPFVSHDDRIEVYKTIIADLKDSDREIESPNYMRDNLKPKSVKDADSQLFNQFNRGGKSRRCRHPRRRHSLSSKKYKKAHKSRRRVRS